MAAPFYTVADVSPGDWFGGFLYSAGQQANEAVQSQLSALSFTRYLSVLSPLSCSSWGEKGTATYPKKLLLPVQQCSLFSLLHSLAVIFGAGLVTSLSPCTLSVLPLTLGYIGKHWMTHNITLFHFSPSLPGLMHFNPPGAFGSGKSRAQVRNFWKNHVFKNRF